MPPLHIINPSGGVASRQPLMVSSSRSAPAVSFLPRSTLIARVAARLASLVPSIVRLWVATHKPNAFAAKASGRARQKPVLLVRSYQTMARDQTTLPTRDALRHSILMKNSVPEQKPVIYKVIENQTLRQHTLNGIASGRQSVTVAVFVERPGDYAHNSGSEGSGHRREIFALLLSLIRFLDAMVDCIEKQ